MSPTTGPDIRPPILPRIYSRATVTAYAIYRTPPGEAGAYCIVRWTIGPDRADRDAGRFAEGDTATVYRLLPDGASQCIRRRADDDPRLVESWIGPAGV